MKKENKIELKKLELRSFSTELVYAGCHHNSAG